MTFDCPAAAFLVALRSRRVDQDPSHQPGRHRQEVGAILPVHVLGVDEAQVSLVNERRRLEAVARTFAGHAPPRDAVQFLLHQGHELRQRGVIALSPRAQETGDAARARHDGRILAFHAVPVFDPSSRLLQ